MCGLLDFNNVA